MITINTIYELYKVKNSTRMNKNTEKGGNWQVMNYHLNHPYDVMTNGQLTTHVWNQRGED
jgi:hypothetical protein